MRTARTPWLAISLPVLFVAAALGGCGNPGAAAHQARGDKALAAGRYGEAIAAYSHARDLAPTDAKAQRGLMKARAFLIAEQPQRIPAELVEDLRYEASFLVESDASSAPVYLTALGNIAARSGNPEEARARYEAALKADPRSPVAHAALGLFFLNQKDGAARAREEFDKVLELKPASPVALVGLAQLSLADGKAEPAAERLEAALKLGDDYTARYLLGGARLKQNRIEDAIAEFQRATQLDPRSAEAHRSLGQALLSANRPEESERELRTAAAIAQDPPTVLALGYALARQKKSDQALGQFALVLQTQSRDAAALYGAASALEDLGRRDEALAMYKRVLALPPQPGSQLLAQLQQQAATRSEALQPKAP